MMVSLFTAQLQCGCLFMNFYCFVGFVIIIKCVCHCVCLFVLLLFVSFLGYLCYLNDCEHFYTLNKLSE